MLQMRDFMGSLRAGSNTRRDETCQAKDSMAGYNL